MTKDVKRLQQIIEMKEDEDGKVVFGSQVPSDVLGRVAKWTEAEGDNIVGTGAATGDTIVSLSVAAYTKFACMSLVVSTNISAMINIAYGTLAAHIDIYHVDLQNAGSLVAVTENTPIFVYNNTTAAAVTLLMIAPLTGKGVAVDNNDANHYFHGYMGGILI